MGETRVSASLTNILSGGAKPAVAYAFLFALGLACIKMAFFLPGEAMTALWEETSIYLNAYQMPLGKFLFYPDAGYINLLPKLTAFFILRILGITTIYPFIFKFLSLFLSAFSLMIFISERFSCVLPLVKLRLALCIFIFLFPENDFFAAYNSSHFIIFFLIYYLIIFVDEIQLSNSLFWFIILTAPIAILAKPIFFMFGFLFFLLFIKVAWHRLSGHHAGYREMCALSWIIFLYSLQFYFTMYYYPELGTSAFSEFFKNKGGFEAIFSLLRRFIICIGYGVAAPINVQHSAQLGPYLFFTAGVAIVCLSFVNSYSYFIKKKWSLLILNGALLACCIFSIYGIFKSIWLYTTTFTDLLYTRPWDHRHLFSFIIFSNLQILSFAARIPWERTTFFVSIAYLSLTILSLFSLNPSYFGAFYQYALHWNESKKLLKEEYVFIPIPQMIPEWLSSYEFAMEFEQHNKYDPRLRGMMYSPTCTWASGISEARLSEKEGTIPVDSMFMFKHSFSIKDRKVKYILMFPKDKDHVFLPEESFLMVISNGHKVKASLINPGSRHFFMFVFDRLVPSQDTTEFTITAPYGYPPRTPCSVLLVGLW